MKKLKLFAIGGSLLLLTAGVFASKSFVTPAIYAVTPNGLGGFVGIDLTTSIPSTNILTTSQSGSDVAVTMADHANVTYGLYEVNSSGVYQPLYPSTAF